jgi:type I protein arginine methyltransferase
MTLASSGIASLRQFRRWLARRVVRPSGIQDMFGSSDSQESLLVDKKRCEAYREAIQRTVKPGDVVVDLGAGTGLLSFFAVQAGAHHVYAIEMSEIADVAAELIATNGLRDRITLIRKESKKARLPERCDVIVTETLSSFCFDGENIIESVADARDRFLKPGGRVIPRSADTFLLPISSDDFGVGRMVSMGLCGESKFYGLDYRPFCKNLLTQCRVLPASGKSFLALGEPAHCYHVDFQKDAQNPGKTFVPFRVTAEGRLDGLLGWFEAHLSENVTISNSPFLPLTPWWQLYLPLAEQPSYQVGQKLLLCLDPHMVDGEAHWSYVVQRATSEG